MLSSYRFIDKMFQRRTSSSHAVLFNTGKLLESSYNSYGGKNRGGPEIVLLHKTADLIVTTSSMRKNAM
jgi:hypothetical protein